MNDMIDIVITIKKDDIFKFSDKFGIKEWHYKDSKVVIDMTHLFDEALKDAKDKTISSEGSVF